MEGDQIAQSVQRRVIYWAAGVPFLAVASFVFTPQLPDRLQGSSSLLYN
jgi:hypothetical protein